MSNHDTWRKQLHRTMRDNGENPDTARIETNLPIGEMDRSVDFGTYNPPKGRHPNQSFLAWTKRFVYFCHEYDGACSIAQVPRNPPQ